MVVLTTAGAHNSQFRSNTSGKCLSLWAWCNKDIILALLACWWEAPEKIILTVTMYILIRLEAFNSSSGESEFSITGGKRGEEKMAVMHVFHWRNAINAWRIYQIKHWSNLLDTCLRSTVKHGFTHLKQMLHHWSSQPRLENTRKETNYMNTNSSVIQTMH